MAHRPDSPDTPATADTADRVDAGLEASLARLGVHELQERLELSPLLAAADVQDADACRCECVCDDTPDDPFERLYLEKPTPTGFGTLV